MLRFVKNNGLLPRSYRNPIGIITPILNIQLGEALFTSENSMAGMILTETPIRLLLLGTIGEFGAALDLIKTIPAEIYYAGSENRRNIGAHIRHNLDFANNYLSGIASGRIDYSNRERDMRVERDRDFAVRSILRVIDRFDAVPANEVDISVVVRSELDSSVWYASSGGRELEFLCSHTVHHHAMVAEKLAALGITAPDNFGVSSTTLKFWNQSNSSLTKATTSAGLQ